MGTSFLKLALLCKALEKTPKINDKVSLISRFLSSLNENEIEPAVLLIIGATFAEIDPQTLDIKWRSIHQTEYTPSQKTLIQKALTIRVVHSYFLKLALISGPGARKKKKRLLQTLFRETSPVEQKFIIGNIMGEMRHGVAEGVMIKAISQSTHIDVDRIKRLNAIRGNLGEIARIAIMEGNKGLDKIKLSLFTPIKPMLADSIDSIEEIFKDSKSTIALEYKYDGVRAQIHKNGKFLRIYSRHRKEITSNFPDIANRVLKAIPTHSAILDGEIIAIGAENRPLAFQELMRRFKRIHGVERIQKTISIRLFLFDILYLDNQILFDLPYQERWNILSNSCDKFLLATRIVSSEETRIREFYQSALDAGHEGVLIKDLQSLYYPGERKKFWLKLKEAIHLDLVIIAADWGSGRRSNWLSNYHLAAIDAETGSFYVIGKTFKGLTDKQFQKITQDLQKIKTHESAFTVFVEPQIVVEVAFNEIQKSPQYPSGYALRFARIKRIRIDKPSKDITTIQEIARLFNRQFDKKARLSI